MRRLEQALARCPAQMKILLVGDQNTTIESLQDQCEGVWQPALRSVAWKTIYNNSYLIADTA